MKSKNRDKWLPGGDVGNPLSPTKKSGGEQELNRKGAVPSGSYDGRDRKVVNGHSNEAFQNSAIDGELTRLIEKAETKGGVHSLRTSGDENERSAIQADGDLSGSPFPKVGKLRKGLSKRNASPVGKSTHSGMPVRSAHGNTVTYQKRTNEYGKDAESTKTS